MLPMTFILIFYFSLQLNISTNTKLVMPQMKMLSFLDYAVYQLISDLLLTTYFNVPILEPSKPTQSVLKLHHI